MTAIMEELSVRACLDLKKLKVCSDLYSNKCLKSKQKIGFQTVSGKGKQTVLAKAAS